MVCQFIGFDHYGDEGKVMGLAPYEEDRYAADFNDMIELRKDGFRLNLKYFMPLGHNQGMEVNEDGTVSLSRCYSDAMIDHFGPPSEAPCHDYAA